jgi:hypothetical protein
VAVLAAHVAGIAHIDLQYGNVLCPEHITIDFTDFLVEGSHCGLSSPSSLFGLFGLFRQIPPSPPFIKGAFFFSPFEKGGCQGDLIKEEFFPPRLPPAGRE